MTEPRAGAIHDLGYRRYEGARMGRRHAIVSLYVHGLRSAFGLGRRTRSKLFPMGLALLAALPAIGYLMAAAFLDLDVSDIFRAEEYFSTVAFLPQAALMLFVAAVAPELLGRDQRHQLLPLYFSRAFSRHDYALARLAAMATALLALTFLPQALLFVGNALVVDDFGGYFRDEWRQIAPIVGSGLLISLFLTGIGMAIAAQTGRRAFATIGIIALFLLLPVISGVLLEQLDNLVGRLAVFLNPFLVTDGFTFWLFGADVADEVGGASENIDAQLRTANFAGGVYLLYSLALTALGGALVVWRYGRKSL